MTFLKNKPVIGGKYRYKKITMTGQFKTYRQNGDKNVQFF